MSMGDSSVPPPRGSLSLYASLLKPPSNSASPSDSSIIARSPVVFSQTGGAAPESQQDEVAAKKHVNAAALRFQPTKRPHLHAQKTKVKCALPTPTPHITVSSSPDHINKSIAPPNAIPVKNTLADWTVDDDDINEFFPGEKRQRGGRKKRKKNNAKEQVVVQDWDDIYDPARPNNYEDYKHSEEKYREIREWKDRLYAHRLARRRDSNASSDRDMSDQHDARSQLGRISKFSFAPPPDLMSNPRTSSITTSPPPPSPLPPPPPPAAEIPDDATGDDAYARRLRLTQQSQNPPLPPSLPPPPPPPDEKSIPSSTISRAPIRYNFPAPPSEIPTSEAALAAALSVDPATGTVNMEPNDNTDENSTPAEDQPDAPRSSRPGQAGFAARLMSKYGWTAGSGLGAAGNEGIVQPLRVQVEKRKKKSDAEGGGWVGPAGGKGRIVDAGRRQDRAAAGGLRGEGARFGQMSEVVVLKGMLGGVDVAAELQRGELVQEIGEECGDKYGRVERVFVHQGSTAAEARVFVKFTSQLSGLRAVNALDGRIFNGNTIKARFYDGEKFEMGVFNHEEPDEG